MFAIINSTRMNDLKLIIGNVLVKLLYVITVRC